MSLLPVRILQDLPSLRGCLLRWKLTRRSMRSLKDLWGLDSTLFYTSGLRLALPHSLWHLLLDRELLHRYKRRLFL